MVKNLPDNTGVTGDSGSIPGLERSPGEGNSNQFQYSCLENPMDRGAGWATVHGVARGWTRLSMHTHVHKSTRSYEVGWGERSRVGWESARFEFFSAGTKGRRAPGVSQGFPSGRLTKSVYVLEASASDPRQVDKMAWCLEGGTHYPHSSPRVGYCWAWEEGDW